jgi:hypothetical protein
MDLSIQGIIHQKKSAGIETAEASSDSNTIFWSEASFLALRHEINDNLTLNYDELDIIL